MKCVCCTDKVVVGGGVDELVLLSKENNNIEHIKVYDAWIIKEVRSIILIGSFHKVFKEAPHAVRAVGENASITIWRLPPTHRRGSFKEQT